MLEREDDLASPQRGQGETDVQVEAQEAPPMALLPSGHLEVMSVETRALDEGAAEDVRAGRELRERRFELIKDSFERPLCVGLHPAQHEARDRSLFQELWRELLASDVHSEPSDVVRGARSESAALDEDPGELSSPSVDDVVGPLEREARSSQTLQPPQDSEPDGHRESDRVQPRRGREEHDARVEVAPWGRGPLTSEAPTPFGLSLGDVHVAVSSCPVGESSEGSQRGGVSDSVSNDSSVHPTMVSASRRLPAEILALAT